MKNYKPAIFLILMVSSLSLMIFGFNSKEAKKIQDPGTISLTQFNQMISQPQKDVLVYFSANWCTICAKMKPVIEQIERESPALEIVRIDTDRDKEVAMEFEVNSLPMLVLYKKAERQWIHVGLIDKTKLKEKIAIY